MAKEATGRKLNVRVKLFNVRASYLHVFKKHAYEDNEPKYSGTFILDPKSREFKKNVQDMNNAIDDVIDATFNGKEPKEIYCEPLKGEEEWKGFTTVKATNHNRPKILDQKREVLYEDDGKPYSGCYVNVILDVYGSPKYKTVQASLMGVQFVRDGDPLSGGHISDDEFDEVEEEDEDTGSKRGRSGGGRSRDRDDSDDRGRSSRGRDRDDDRGRDRDDDRKPARSRNRDDDEAEEAPRRRSSKDDDDEAPRRRSSRDDDDEAPRRRSSKDDDDEAPRRSSRDSDKPRRRDFND